MPLAFPAIVAGSIFTFSLTLGDFITPELVGGSTQFIGSVVYDNFASNLPLAAAFTTVPIIVMTIYLLDRQAPRGVRAPVGRCGSRRDNSSSCGSAAFAVLAFIYVPLIIIGIEAFNEARTLKWPPPGFTTEWFQRAFENTGARDAFLYSLQTARDRDIDRARARHPRGARGFAVPLLRPRDRLLPRHPADRAPGHRHRDRAQFDVHARSSGSTSAC